MKPKPQATELIKQQKGLNRMMYKYAKGDRRNRTAYLTQVQKIKRFLMGNKIKKMSKENNHCNHKKEIVKYPTRKGLTRTHERQLLKEKEVRPR